jgi:hypothetical protein
VDGWDGAGTDSNDEKIQFWVVEIHGNPWKSYDIILDCTRIYHMFADESGSGPGNLT